MAARVSTGSYTPFLVCYIQLRVDKCGRQEEEVKGSGGEGKTPSQDAERVGGVGGRMHGSEPAGGGRGARTRAAERGMGRNGGQHEEPRDRSTVDLCVSRQENWGEACGIWGLQGGSIRKRALD